MHKFLKPTTVIIFGITGITAVIAWGVNNQLWKLTATPIAIAALVGFLALHFRRDLATDFLKLQYNSYFERNGFCFLILFNSKDGIAILDIPFQNRYERYSVAQIALREKKIFILDVPKKPLITVEIECGPAAFGIAHFPIAIPAESQGKVLHFEIGTSVHYPEGRGKMLRFRDGIAVPHNIRFSSFSLAAENLIFTFFHLLTPHHFFLHHQADAAMTKQPLPSGVAEKLPKGIEPSMEVIWDISDSGSAMEKEEI